MRGWFRFEEIMPEVSLLAALRAVRAAHCASAPPLTARLISKASGKLSAVWGCAGRAWDAAVAAGGGSSRFRGRGRRLGWLRRGVGKGQAGGGQDDVWVLSAGHPHPVPARSRCTHGLVVGGHAANAGVLRVRCRYSPASVGSGREGKELFAVGGGGNHRAVGVAQLKGELAGFLGAGRSAPCRCQRNAGGLGGVHVAEDHCPGQVTLAVRWPEAIVDDPTR